MYVACSTLCFARHPLEQALRMIAELEFRKVDVAIHESGPHLRPSQVVQDVSLAAQQIRIGPTLTPSAFSVEIEASDETEYRRQLKGICQLARLSAVSVLTIPAAPIGQGIDLEVRRLKELVRMTGAEGLVLTVDTRMGTLTELPETAVELCKKVPGLGLTLDPSHYTAGPNQGKSFEAVYRYVRHVHLRDTGRSPELFQVRVGQGEIEYGKIITGLSRFNYDRLLTVDIRDIADAPYALDAEARKLKYLLESLI